MEFDEGCPPLVLVNGSMFKAGFAGDDAPRAVFPTVVGRPRHAGVMFGMGQKDAYVGDEARSRHSILTRKFPFVAGDIDNWDDMEKIYHHTFYNELRSAPEDHAVLLTRTSVMGDYTLEKLTHIMFETFNVPMLSLPHEDQLVTLEAGQVTAAVVHMGDTREQIQLVYEGCAVENVHDAVGIDDHNWAGGRSCTSYVMKLLAERGYSFATMAEREIVRDIKENLCYVALDPEKEMKLATEGFALEKSYELPDGGIISVHTERFRGPEIIFDPSLLDAELAGRGLHHRIAHVIARMPRCHVDRTSDVFGCSYLAQLPPELLDRVERMTPNWDREMYQHILLAGGHSMFPGIARRLQKELTGLAPPAVKIKVLAPPERKYSSWIGGSILGSLSNFPAWCLSKEHYDEIGPRASRWLC